MDKLRDFLAGKLGAIPEDKVDFCVSAIFVVLIFAAAFALACVLRIVFFKIAKRFLERKNPYVRNAIASHNLIGKLASFLPALLILAFLPAVFYAGEPGANIVERFCLIWIIVLGVRLLNSLLSALNEIFSKKKAANGGNYVKGFVQIFQVVVVFVAAIIIIGILIDKSPRSLLTGLGASAAILMLVFKDTILGFVAGIQLSLNDMLRIGDWITVKKYNADGNVIEVGLNAVKVYNFDNTITTIPPYALVSDSFQNWRTMEISGGRRVMRSILIDQQSIKFCSPKDFASLREKSETSAFLEKFTPENFSADAEGKTLTNLGLFRAYAEFLIRNNPSVNLQMTYMVRELEPTSQGLPLQFYFFVNNTEWVAFERIQADFMDMFIALLPLFDLRIYQEESDFGES